MAKGDFGSVDLVFGDLDNRITGSVLKIYPPNTDPIDQLVFRGVGHFNALNQFFSC